MAKIKKRGMKGRETTGELFPSLIAVSDDLYNHIVRIIKKRFGARLREITKEMILEALVAPLFKNVVLIAKNYAVSLAVTVTDVLFLSPHDCLVTARLLFPLYGKGKEITTLLEAIARKVGLEEDVSCAEYGMEVKINLGGEFLPCQIIPSPLSNGNGQKVFVAKKEILSLSPIR